MITTFPISSSDQLALMALADQLRRARRRFRRGPTARGRLLFVGDDADGKRQLAEAVGYRAESPLLRMDWTEWDPDGDSRLAFDKAFSMARQQRIGVVVVHGAARFTPDEAARLAAAVDAIDWPLILIVTCEEQSDIERSITARLDRTICLQAPGLGANLSA